MTFNPYTNRSPWALLTEEEREHFRKADPKDVLSYFYSDEEWFSKKCNTANNANTIYRLAPHPIDYCFDLFDDSYIWGATDKNGTKCLFTHEPNIHEAAWVIYVGSMIFLPAELKCYKPLPEGVDWKDSLRKRDGV